METIIHALNNLIQLIYL